MELPALRSDLIIKSQTIGKQQSYIFKDPVKQSYFRFEDEEHFVLTHLDGRISADDLATAYNEKFDDEMTGKDMEGFVSSVRSMDLFEKNQEEENTFLYEKMKEQRKSRIIQAKGSAMYFRVQVWDPDSFFELIMPYIHWIWSPRFVMLMNLFMLFSFLILLQNYGQIQVGMDSVLDFMSKDAASLFLLWVTVLGTIAIHEIGHGLTCKRFGGECHEIGVLVMFFNPCLYANVNDAWMFDKKSHQLYVTFAGCYIEIMTGFLSMYVWLFTQPGSMINIISFQVVVVAFFSAIFMNFNPLMKFDGYFALSDALRMPNLRDRSRDYIKYLLQKYIFRLDRDFDTLSKEEQWAFFAYGSMVTLYLTNVMVFLAVMLGGMMISTFGTRLGSVFALLLYNKLFGHYLRGLISFIKVLMVEHQIFFQNKLVRALGGILVIIMLAVFTLFPFSHFLELPATLTPVKETIIRPLASGYVLKLENPNQKQFKKGEELLRLKNPDLQMQIQNQKLDIELNEMALQRAHADENPQSLIQLEETQKKLENALSDLERQQKELVLYAPFDGELKATLAASEYTYVAVGDEVGQLVDSSHYEAVLDITERDIEGIQEGTQGFLMLTSKPSSLFEGKVTRIAPTYQMQGIARTYQLTVTFPNEDHSLRSGLNGVVALSIGKATMLQRLGRLIQKTIRLDLQF